MAQPRPTEPTTEARLRPIEDAMASAIRKRQHAEASRDRAQARAVRLGTELDRRRAERDRLLTGSTAVLPAPARLIVVGKLWYQAVTCPYCGQEHRHGGEETPPPAGLRYSHCHAPFSNRTYRLIVEAPLPAEGEAA